MTEPSDSYDEPYQYRPPTVNWPFPFNSHELARLQVLRGRVDVEQRHRALLEHVKQRS